MPTSRRSLISAAFGAPLLAVVGCTPDPTIERPASLPSASMPVQSGSARLSTIHVAAIRSVAAAVAGDSAVSAPVVAQCDAYLERLLSVDPSSPGSPQSHPSPSPSAVAGATIADVIAVASAAAADLQRAVTEAEGTTLRLLFASLAAGIAALGAPRLAAGATSEVPADSGTLELADALGVALDQVRTLIHAIEVGLARLDSDSALASAGQARLATAKALRNNLWDALSETAPEQAVNPPLPNAMGNDAEISAAWATLELGILDRLVVAVAADEADSVWFGPMITQVAAAQASGGKVDVWPGWV